MTLRIPRPLALAFAMAAFAFVLGSADSRSRPASAAAPRLSIEDFRQALLDGETISRSAPPALRVADVAPADLVAGRALVSFAASVPSDRALALAASVGEVTRAMPEIQTYEVALRDQTPVQDGIAALSALPGATGAEPVVQFHAAFHPNDPLYDQYQVKYLPMIHAEEAWDIQQGDPKVVTAILDSGVDINHPDLANQIWTNPSPGSSGCGNDVHGCNFVDPRDVSRSCPNQNGSPVPNADVSPYYFHGTMVAGVVGAAANNGIGVAGVVPHASLMPVKVGDCRGPTNAAIAQGILYAAKNGARVINISAGGTSNCLVLPAAIFNAVIEAHRQGVVIVAASGNEGDPCVGSPANYDGVIAVGAVSSLGDSRASFSNWGREIAVVAPGVGIASTSLPGTRTLRPPYEAYEVESGTSFSSPIVAGLADLLISQNTLLTPDMVRSLMQKSATPLADRGDPGWAGAGRVDLEASLRLVPEALYGTVNLPGVGEAATVEARVGALLCGTGTTSLKQGQTLYTIFVKAAAEQPGCGTSGSSVSLTVNGSPAGSAAWKPAATPLDLPGSASSVTAAGPTAVGAASSPASAVLYHRGWNIVAAPQGTRFAVVTSPLFTLQPGDTGYESVQSGDPTRAGFGYWAYFAADTTVPFAADTTQSYSVALPAGQFVLVGDPSGTREVTISGADLAYVYDPVAGSYGQTTTLQPGQGAWVLSSAGGTLTLN